MKRKPRNNDAPNIAILGTRGYPSFYGGFETAVRKLAPFLVDRGWDVTVYGRKGAIRANAPTDTRVRSVVTWGIESKSLSTLSFGFSSALDAVKRRPDVAIVMNVANGFVLPLLAMRGIPTLVNVDGIEWEREKWGKLAKLVFKLGARAVARWGTNIVYDSKEIEQRWRREFGRDGVFIPYGGDERELLTLGDGLEKGGYVLYVARLVPENSVSEFLEAASFLANEMKVVVVGSSGYGGEYEDKLRQLSDNHENFSWLGHVSDDDQLHALWQHAGVYFHGHSVGGTNPALVQAMALGAPVVARDTVYNREVLGAKGQFCEPTPQSIAAAIRRVIVDQDLRAELSKEAKKRAASAYSWQYVNELYEESARQLLPARKRTAS
jgi:glycosyltransferase involved in cell wall biosynthesis